MGNLNAKNCHVQYQTLHFLYFVMFYNLFHFSTSQFINFFTLLSMSFVVLRFGCHMVREFFFIVSSLKILDVLILCYLLLLILFSLLLLQCGVINLPTQILVLSNFDRPGQLTGMIFPRVCWNFKICSANLISFPQ